MSDNNQISINLNNPSYNNSSSSFNWQSLYNQSLSNLINFNFLPNLKSDNNSNIVNKVKFIHFLFYKKIYFKDKNNQKSQKSHLVPPSNNSIDLASNIKNFIDDSSIFNPNITDFDGILTNCGNEQAKNLLKTIAASSLFFSSNFGPYSAATFPFLNNVDLNNCLGILPLLNEQSSNNISINKTPNVSKVKIFFNK